MKHLLLLSYHYTSGACCTPFFSFLFCLCCSSFFLFLHCFLSSPGNKKQKVCPRALFWFGSLLEDNLFASSCSSFLPEKKVEQMEYYVQNRLANKMRLLCRRHNLNQDCFDRSKITILCISYYRFSCMTFFLEVKRFTIWK